MTRIIRKYIVSITAFVLLASCTSPQIFGLQNVQSTVYISSVGTINDSNVLTWLHTDGRYIKNGRNETVVLKGCAWHELCWKKTLENDLETRVDQMQIYGVNIIRLCLNPTYWDDPSYIDLVDQIVNELEERKIYVIIDFHIGTADADLWNNDAKIDAIEDPGWWTDWFRNVTIRYIDKPNVALYHLFNEPPEAGQGYTIDQLQNMWWSVALNASRAIHAINPRVIVIVESVATADRIRFINNPLPEPNIVYAFHRYYCFDMGWEDYAKSYEQGNFEAAKQQMESFFGDIAFDMLNLGYPIILLEFGARTDDPNWDVQITDLYNLLDKYEVSWNQWAWYGHGRNFDLLESDWVTLSPQGVLWKEHVNSF